MGTLWLYWERPRGRREDPPYIRLCRKSVEVHARGHDVRLVTPENLRTYLPDLPARWRKIRLRPRGRIEKYLCRRQRNARASAQRADFVRAFLLEKYGGFYLDSDAILLGDLTRYFTILESHDFCVTRRSSFGKSYASVNFYGSQPHGVIISEYARLLRGRLAGALDYQWNEVGADMLTPVVARHQALAFDIPEREVQPVTFENAEAMFTNRSLELGELTGPETAIFMLYSGPFRGALRNASLNRLYGSEMLISKAFRAALPAASYEQVAHEALRRSAHSLFPLPGIALLQPSQR